jgi:CelD/BcsL family acetyltransferase involved in cellulose biosynthesis
VARRCRALSGTDHISAAPAAGETDGWSAAVIDPLTDDRWLAFLNASPGAEIFHHPAWLALLARIYAFPVAACCLLDRDGVIGGGAPLALVASRLTGRRLVCVPFSDRCAPLPSPDEQPATAARLVTALDRARRSYRLPLHVHGPLSPAPGLRPLARYHHHVVALEADVDAVIRRFHLRSQLLRGVRRAQREGLVVERRTDGGALADFYRLNLATRRRQGVPVQPRRFIADLETLFAAGLGFVLLVRDGPRPIAAAVFLTFNGTLTYKYGASDAAYLAKRPNNLLFLEAIRWGCQAGLQRLDLGRTDLGHEGLRAFKRSWGAEERLLEYQALADRERRSSGRTLAERAAPLVKRSPLAINRLLGELLYRHMG